MKLVKILSVLCLGSSLSYASTDGISEMNKPVCSSSLNPVDSRENNKEISLTEGGGLGEVGAPKLHEDEERAEWASDASSASGSDIVDPVDPIDRSASTSPLVKCDPKQGGRMVSFNVDVVEKAEKLASGRESSVVNDEEEIDSPASTSPLIPYNPKVGGRMRFFNGLEDDSNEESHLMRKFLVLTPAIALHTLALIELLSTPVDHCYGPWAKGALYMCYINSGVLSLMVVGYSIPYLKYVYAMPVMISLYYLAQDPQCSFDINQHR